MSEHITGEMLATSPLGRALAERYTVLRELGAGGMATVFLAEDLRHRRKVAIKVLHPELSAVIGSERFLKEIELTANLQHPHILPLFDSGDVTGQLYYVMPFVEGETLRSRLDREQQLPVGDAVRIAREVADALSYAHKRNVVHRDIKPENILLQDGHALVADFGIALAVQQAGAGRLTQTGLSLGTPQYMSPEQAMGERTIDLRADIYALGAVTYEMLAGEPPFTGPTAQAIIARAMTERPRSLSSVRETLPPGVDTAVMTALAKLPADRFSSATEFAEALVVTSTSVQPAYGAVELPRRGIRGARWIPWAMLSAGLLIGGIAAMLARGPTRDHDREGVPRFLAVALPENAPFVVGHELLGSYVRSLDISPDGDRIAWTSERDSSTSVLWMLRTDLGTASQIPGSDGAILPTFSPDGKAIAFSLRGSIMRMDVAANTMIRVGSSAALAEATDAIYWLTPDRILASGWNGCPESAPATGGDFVHLQGRICSVFSLARGNASARLLASDGTVGLLNEANSQIDYVRGAGGSDTSSSAFVAGESPKLVGNALVFLRDSTLYGATIDAARKQLTGEPRPLLAGVRREANGASQMALSGDGTFVWLSGGDAGVSRFVFVSPATHAIDTVVTQPAVVSSYALSNDGSRLAYSVALAGNRSSLHVIDLRRGIADSTRFGLDLQVANWVDADSGIAVLLNKRPRSGHAYGVVRGTGAVAKLDTSGADYIASSRDGRLRCTNNGFLWATSAPKDTVRINSKSNWCRFSPDGQHVSWTELDGVMVAPTTPNAGAMRRRISPPGADEARWSADGREIIYRAGNRWLAVPSDPPAGGPLSTPRVVVQGTYNQAWSSWDLAPDGRMLLLQGAPPTRATHLNIITNFPRYVEEQLRTSTR